jgi:predicted nucleic acid-binding protein
VTVFIDTSAFFAILDADDQNHSAAGRIWKTLLKQSAELVCTNYILIECFALLQR